MLTGARDVAPRLRRGWSRGPGERAAGMIVWGSAEDDDQAGDALSCERDVGPSAGGDFADGPTPRAPAWCALTPQRG